MNLVPGVDEVVDGQRAGRLRQRAVRSLQVVLFLSVSGTALPASAGDFVENWRIETRIGYTRPEAGVEEAFGGGVNAGWVLGRRLGRLVAESGFDVASVSYGAAQAVTAPVCTAVGRTALACTPQQTRQRGDGATATLGLSLPLSSGAGGRMLWFSTGALLRHMSVGPRGDSLGSRESLGVYLTVAGDGVPIGRLAALGVALRGSCASGHGASLGTVLPPKTLDAWIDLSLVVRIGAASRSR